MIEINEKGDAVTFRVRVVPRASKTEIAGEFDGALKVRIASAPVDGAANEELIRFLSKLLSVARSDIGIVAGATSKSKLVRIENLGASGVSKVTSLIDPKTA